MKKSDARAPVAPNNCAAIRAVLPLPFEPVTGDGAAGNLFRVDARKLPS